jgi:hypothetical protein
LARLRSISEKAGKYLKDDLKKQGKYTIEQIEKVESEMRREPVSLVSKEAYNR